MGDEPILFFFNFLYALRGQALVGAVISIRVARGN